MNYEDLCSVSNSFSQINMQLLFLSQIRLVFSWFFYFWGNLGNVKEKLTTEAVTRGVLQKKVFLEISLKSQENNNARVFFNKVAGLRPATLLKKTLAHAFTCEFCEISKNTFFTKHLRTTASIKNLFSVKRSAWLYAFTSQNIARRHFFDVNEVSIVFS